MTSAPSSSAALIAFSHSICHAGRASAALEMCMDDVEIQTPSEPIKASHFLATFSTVTPFDYILSDHSSLVLCSGRCEYCLQYLPGFGFNILQVILRHQTLRVDLAQILSP